MFSFREHQTLYLAQLQCNHKEEISIISSDGIFISLFISFTLTLILINFYVNVKKI